MPATRPTTTRVHRHARGITAARRGARALSAHGHGATAGPRICAWCHAPLADDARTEAIGGAELHAECALSFDAWANDGHDATPHDCSDD